MARLIEKIGEFDLATENWTSYLVQLTHYFATNRIEEEKKKDTFLCCSGRETFGFLSALVALQKAREKTFKKLTNALTAHLAPKPHGNKQRVRPLKSMPLACRNFRNTAISAVACLIPSETDWCMRDEKVQRRGLNIQESPGGS